MGGCAGSASAAAARARGAGGSAARARPLWEPLPSAAPRRAAAARRPPPRAHRVRRGAGSGGSRLLRRLRGDAWSRGGRTPAPGRLACGLTGTGTAAVRASHLQRGECGARGVGVPSGGRCPGQREACFWEKWGTRPGPAGEARAGQGNSPLGSPDRSMAPTPCRSSVTRPRSLSATRGGHADPPAPPPTPGSAPPPRAVGVEERWGEQQQPVGAGSDACRGPRWPGDLRDALGVWVRVLANPGWIESGMDSVT